MNKLLLIIGGIINLMLVIFHLSFWKIFNWAEGLNCLNFIDRGITQILNIQLAFVVLVFAVVSIFCYKELISTKLGKMMLISISVFCFLRAVNQVIFFDITVLTSLIIFIGCIIVGTMYLIPLFAFKRITNAEQGHCMPGVRPNPTARGKR